MQFNDMFPGNYLRAADLTGQQITLTIGSVTMENLNGQMKPCLMFYGQDRGLILNKTNGQTIADSYGGDSDLWIGKQVTLFPSTTQYQGQNVPCIRVMAQPQAAPAVAPPVAAAPPQQPPQPAVAPAPAAPPVTQQQPSQPQQQPLTPPGYVDPGESDIPF